MSDNRQTEAACECPPCPGRGNDGHGLTHCAECCFGTGVEADLDCPIHGVEDGVFGDPLIHALLTGAVPYPPALHGQEDDQ